MDGTKLSFSFDAAQVALSVFISFMGCVAAVELNETRRFETNSWKRIRLAVLVAAVVGTTAIWCMHFVGMAALILYSPTGEALTLKYRLDMSVASWLAAVVLQAFGVWIVATKDPFFSAVDRDCAVALIRKELLCKSMETLQSRKPERIVATIKVQWILIGGLISGLGVCVMHYVGLLSQVSESQLSPSGGFIFLSVVLAVSAATAAYWILFRLPLLYWDSIYLRLLSASLMTIAVTSMHYSGMYGMEYSYAPQLDAVDSFSITQRTQTLIATFVALATFTVVMTWLIADLRSQMAVVAKEKSKACSKRPQSVSSYDRKSTSHQFTTDMSVYSKSKTPRAVSQMPSVQQVSTFTTTGDGDLSCANGFVQMSHLTVSNIGSKQSSNASKVGGSTRSSISSGTLAPIPVQPSSCATTSSHSTNSTANSLRPLKPPLSPLTSSNFGSKPPPSLPKIDGPSISSAASQDSHVHPHARLNVVFDGTQSLPGASEFGGK